MISLGMNWSDKPFWRWYCTKCKYLESIEDNNGNKADIYKSCSLVGDSEYIIVLSDRDGDYITTSLHSLVWGYMQAHSPAWRGEKNENE